MTPAIALRRVTLAYGQRTVLDAVELEIADGQFVGVLGANGSGKTTLLRAILGLVPVGGGTILVGGRSVRRGDARIGYLPQARVPLTPARLSGWSFVASAWRGERWGLPFAGRDGRREVDRAIGLVDASALARRPIAELSGGERQRLLLAQALLGRPRLLLLDEPLISLDPRHQTGVVELVRSVQRALGMTVLFSAHELTPLLGALDQVLYLGHGQAALGSVDDVITGPVLSRLYGAPVEVLRVQGRLFVVSGGRDIEADAHAAHAHA